MNTRANRTLAYPISPCMSITTAFVRLRANTEAANERILEIIEELVVDGGQVEWATEELIRTYLAFFDRRATLRRELQAVIAEKRVDEEMTGM